MESADLDANYEPRACRLTMSSPTGPGEIAYLDYGPPERAPDLVFLHANGFNARAYRTILGPLAADLRIIAPDQRGHGATTLATDRPRDSWLDLKDDLLAFLDAMRIERVALAGHSMGGAVSLLAAAEAPARVRALTLLDPVVMRASKLAPAAPSEAMRASPMVAGAMRRRRAFPSRAAAVDSYRGRGAFRTWTEAMLEDYVAAGFRDAPNGGVELACTPEWEVSNYVSQGHDVWSAFFDTACPIRVLRAESGSTARIEDQVAELAATGRIVVETVPGTTHFLPMERPELVREAIIEAVRAP